MKEEQTLSLCDDCAISLDEQIRDSMRGQRELVAIGEPSIGYCFLCGNMTVKICDYKHQGSSAS